jgi:uncharacterized membrane protein (UPF0127 family)
MRVGLIASLSLALLMTGGCKRPAPPTPAAVVAEQPASGQPQPKLPTIKLWLGPKEILVEQAVGPEEVHTGMMFRKEMGENEGMLFVFAAPSQVSFWMRNTLLPLSCAYIDPAGVIVEIHDMKPLDETPIEAASSQIQYVLEMKQGWFERNQIAIGTSIRTERGTLAETYFGRR